MKLKFFSLFLLVVIASLTISYFSVFTIPQKPELVSIDRTDTRTDWFCHQSNAEPEFIDENGMFNLVVWNIHKQSEEGWQNSLQEYGNHSQLMMLQEASVNDEFQEWLQQQSWLASHVNAFKVFGESAGVLNLSNAMASRACAYTAVEPWILLPKSALYARYSLSNGQELVTVNLHAINFTVGTENFLQQIEQLSNAVKKHQGPLIIAGDFNTWSHSRLEELNHRMALLEMKQVRFIPDHRKRFINGLAFDHVYYRGLTLVDAAAPEATTSDHNPMLVSFRLKHPTK